MKKLISMITAVIMVLSLIGTAFVFAEEAVEDPTTIRVTNYEEGSISPSVWLNTFNSDDECVGTDYVIFNTAADIKGIGLPVVYAGKPENDQDASVRFELFAWDTDAAKTLQGTALLNEEVHFTGDTQNVEFKFESPLAKGQYLFRASQTTGKEGNYESVSHYSVLPQGDFKYSPTVMEYDTKGAFAFFVDFQVTDGVTNYFVGLQGSATDIEIQKEKTLIARNGDTPHEIIEFGIVTPEIPAEQVLYSINLSNSPTWNNTNGDSDVEVSVYKWTGDYDESVVGQEVFNCEVLDHADNSNLVIKFDGSSLRYGRRYLIVIYQSNSGKVGYWQGVDDRPDGWEFYENGVEVDYNPAMKCTYAIVGDLGPEPTEAPTAEPTEVPPTEVPTEVPVTAAPTDAPATDKPAETEKAGEATDKPAATENQGGNSGEKTQEEKKNIVPIIVIIACAVVVLACVAVILISRKKKK